MFSGGNSQVFWNYVKRWDINDEQIWSNISHDKVWSTSLKIMIFSQCTKRTLSTIFLKLTTLDFHLQSSTKLLRQKWKFTYIAKLIAQFLSPCPSTNIEIELKPRDIIWLNEFNYGYGVGRGFSLKLSPDPKSFNKFNLSQLFLLMLSLIHISEPTRPY